MSLITIFNIDSVCDVLTAKGYKFFTNGDFNVNIIGVRCDTNVANSFDDNLVLFYKEGGSWNFHTYPITTDAGTYWLKNPLNNKGTAILIPNQYRSTWIIDLHQGKYEALCQRKGKVKVWRDNNKDNILDFDGAVVDTGFFGINIHRSNPYTESWAVEKWSAGCQVFKKVEDFIFFMDICKKSSEKYGNSFTYTLLEENDFYETKDLIL